MRATDTFENVIGKVHRMSQDYYDETYCCSGHGIQWF